MWCKASEQQFSHFVRFKKKPLCTSATSVPSKHVFSACSMLVNKPCCSLQLSTVDGMISLSKNGMLKACRTNPTTTPAVPTLARNQSAAEDEDEPVLPEVSSH
eukprot:scpid96256/ scgid8534/ 